MVLEILASTAPAWDAYIDLYCERVRDGFFEEPLNVASNMLFFVASLFLWRKLGKSHIRDTRFLRILVILTFLVGVGSTILHMYARMWSSLADIIPIGVFAIILIYNFARIPFKQSRLNSVLVVIGFAVFNIIYKKIIPVSIDGHVSLLPNAGIMCALSLYMLHTKNPSAVVFLKATIIASVAILLRTVDTMMNVADTCHYLLWGVGTHFIWHMAMAWFVYLLVEELIIRRLTAVSNKEQLLRKLRHPEDGLKLMEELKKEGLRFKRRSRKRSKKPS